MIVLVPPDTAAKVWPVVEPMLARAVALTNGCFETVDVLRAILNDQSQLWVAYDGDTKVISAAMTTSIQVYPRRRSLRVEFIGGSKLRSWAKEFIAALDDFSRSKNITLQEGSFREGWERVWTGCKRHGASFIRDVPA